MCFVFLEHVLLLCAYFSIPFMLKFNFGSSCCSTFVCPTEIIAFSDRVDEFRKIGCEVVAASTDSHFCHLAWVNTPRKDGGLGNMNIPLLADKSAIIAKAYGVYNEETGIPFRGLFIIDDKGVLRQVTINDLPVGRSVDETLRLVQAFQFTDKNGEGKTFKIFSFLHFFQALELTSTIIFCYHYYSHSLIVV